MWGSKGYEGLGVAAGEGGRRGEGSRWKHAGTALGFTRRISYDFHLVIPLE